MQIEITETADGQKVVTCDGAELGRFTPGQNPVYVLKNGRYYQPHAEEDEDEISLILKVHGLSDYAPRL